MDKKNLIITAGTNEVTVKLNEKVSVGLTENENYTIEYKNVKGTYGVILASNRDLEDCIRHLLDYAQDNGYFTYFAPKEN